VSRFDVAIVGAGIAGATLAAELAPHASVLLLEAEDAPGYHATGRSAAFWSETYGGPSIQPLTTASRSALAEYLEPLGALHVGREEDRAAAERFVAEFARTSVALEPVDAQARVPGLRAEWTVGVWEPSCAYIDVARFHGDALAAARRAGAVLRTGAAVAGSLRENGRWTIGGDTADVLVNAAGAWADEVAASAGVRPLGIRPYRRTMVQLRTEPSVPSGLPMIADLGGGFYFKPAGNDRLWLSPHDEIASDPCDAAPEELDVAIAIDRFEGVVDWRVAAVERRWAGLRSFAPDRLPVYGFHASAPGFFWCAGQGGFGIQTAPAAARLAAALLLGRSVEAGIDAERYDPARFHSTVGRRRTT
jgi:D-arginine dehydrogenase